MEKTKKKVPDYKMTYPRLINSMRWKFGYVFFEKKKKKGKHCVRKIMQ